MKKTFKLVMLIAFFSIVSMAMQVTASFAAPQGNSSKGAASTILSPSHQNASIGNFVWHDLYVDQSHIVDGIQDAGEPGIAVVEVELYDSNGALVKTASTDTSGYYQFTGLAADDYTVKVADSNFAAGGVLEGWYASPPNAGSDETLDSDGDRNTHEASVTLNADENNNDIDFAFFATSVDLQKTGPDSITLGNDITYHFRIENTGDIVLHGGAQVYDALIEPDGDHEIWSGVVYPGEVYEFDRTYTPDEDDCGSVTNTANAVGHPQYPDGSYVDDVTDESSWTTQVLCDTASLGDYVWYDANGDGVQDTGESGLNDVTVVIYADDGDGVFEPEADDSHVNNMATSGNGYYDFTGLAAGNYWVDVYDESVPSGYVLTSGNDPVLVTLAEGQDFNDADFGYQELTNSTCVVIQRPGSTHEEVLDAYIWAASPDSNSGNSDTLYTGMVGSGEKRSLLWFDLAEIPGGSVIDSATFGIYARTSQSQVVRTHQITNSWEETTVTWNNFNNSFAQETEGYLITDSTGFHYIDLTEMTRGWWNGAYENYGILLEENLNTYDTYKSSEYGTASYRPKLEVCYHVPLASLGDYVWEDMNADGVQDAGEPGIDGVTVELFKSDGATMGTTTTANGGQYDFTDLVPGDYYVQFTLPSGYVFSPQDQGNDATDSDADTTTGRTATTTLTAAENDPTWDAGMYKKASLGDYVWWDLNEDGVQDANDSGLQDVTVTLKDANGDTVATTTTDANGAYSFTDLPPGDYTVVFTKPSNDWSFSPQDQGDDAKDSDANPTNGEASVTLTSGLDDDTIDAGLTILSSYTITKENTTAESEVAPGDPISFTLTIKNTGSTWLTVIPLRDSYDTNYLTYVDADPASEDNNDDGVIDWSDLAISFGEDLAPGESFPVVVNFTAKAPTDDLSNHETINTATAHDVQSDPDGSNGPTSAAALPDQSDEAPASILDPVGEPMGGFSTAVVEANTVRLRWQSESEANILGFNVLRRTGKGRFERVNDGLIFARYAGADTGSAYNFVDRGLSENRYTYVLEIVRLDGGVERYGRVSVHILAHPLRPSGQN